MSAIAELWDDAAAALEAYKTAAEDFLVTETVDAMGDGELPSTSGPGDLNSYARQAALEAIRDANLALAELRANGGRTGRKLTAQGL